MTHRVTAPRILLAIIIAAFAIAALKQSTWVLRRIEVTPDDPSNRYSKYGSRGWLDRAMYFDVDIGVVETRIILHVYRWAEPTRGVWDRLEGPYHEYAGEAKTVEGRFEDGFQEGLWTFWYPDGRVLGQLEFTDDSTPNCRGAPPWWGDMTDHPRPR